MLAIMVEVRHSEGETLCRLRRYLFCPWCVSLLLSLPPSQRPRLRPTLTTLIFPREEREYEALRPGAVPLFIHKTTKKWRIVLLWTNCLRQRRTNTRKMRRKSCHSKCLHITAVPVILFLCIQWWSPRESLHKKDFCVYLT